MDHRSITPIPATTRGEQHWASTGSEIMRKDTDLLIAELTNPTDNARGHTRN